MQKFSKRGVLLFAAAMALCALVMPSLASAVSWSPAGLETTIDSPDIGFTSTADNGLQIISSCASSSFTGTVNSTGSAIEITAGTFARCVASLPNAGNRNCTVTSVGTRFPWTATVPSTDNIQIHGIHVDVTFENTPGNTTCAEAGLNGANITITGTLGGGTWTGNSTRMIDFADDAGLVSHSILGLGTPVTVRGTLLSTGNLSVL